jgi:hypothetical protein
MPAPAGAIGELEFLTKLQRILGEGLFVASYKYALLLDLAELSVEKTIAPDGTLAIELDELAERFVTRYWRQVAPFGGAAMLWHNAGKQASVVNKIAELKSRAPTLAAARRHKRWAALVRDVAKLLKVMPLWKLQLVGRERLDFLYEERLIDGAIVLRPGEPENKLHDRPIWLRLVSGCRCSSKTGREIPSWDGWWIRRST